jgi:diaminopimelate decarboxylase
MPEPDVELGDALRAILDDLPPNWDTGETPRTVLLPTRTQERFAAFAEAADRIESTFDLDAARVGLSIKTNPDERLLDAARETGMLAETIHPDEMAHARQHGYAIDEIIVNGPVQALLPDLEAAPYALFGDAVCDLDDLSVDPSGAIVGVRTRPPERGPSRFGVDLSDPDRMARLCDRLAALPDAARLGLHLHAPSSTLGHDRWWASLDRVLRWAQAIQVRTGRPVEGLDLGGGWHPDDWLDVFVPSLLDRTEQIRRALPALSVLLLEPGKALSQPLGVVVSRVLDARPTRNEVILDASLAELSNIDYHPHRLLAHTAERGWHRLPRGSGRLLGRLCMEADVLGRRRQVDHLSPGDTIVVCDAGAYDASMTYPFGRGNTATP